MQAEKSHFGSQGEYVREKYSLSPPLPWIYLFMKKIFKIYEFTVAFL